MCALSLSFLRSSDDPPPVEVEERAGDVAGSLPIDGELGLEDRETERRELALELVPPAPPPAPLLLPDVEPEAEETTDEAACLAAANISSARHTRRKLAHAGGCLV